MPGTFPPRRFPKLPSWGIECGQVQCDQLSGRQEAGENELYSRPRSYLPNTAAYINVNAK